MQAIFWWRFIWANIHREQVRYIQRQAKAVKKGGWVAIDATAVPAIPRNALRQAMPIEQAGRKSPDNATRF